jgi:hypothetical protein
MKPRSAAGAGLPRRLFLIVAAAAVMFLVIRALDVTLAERTVDAGRPALPSLTADPPIAAEANVFRTRPGDLSLGPDLARRRPAHPRTMATYRSLRAFPGAPPRIPHGLTADEFRSTGCNSCHERGGFSARFEAYAPVTPHPELADCLQCHTANDALTGIALPHAAPDAHCRQCHAPGPARPPYSALDWQPLAWPKLQGPDSAKPPPVIPHDLQLRSNCLSCHMGVAAPAEIRTDHPERANCRQCHLAPDSAVFNRVSGADARAGGVP